MAKKSGGSYPLTAGGRSLKRSRGKDGGGKRRSRKANWTCIGCDTQHTGQKCKRWSFKRSVDVPAGYLREGGFTAEELGER